MDVYVNCRYLLFSVAEMGKVNSEGAILERESDLDLSARLLHNIKTQGKGCLSLSSK